MRGSYSQGGEDLVVDQLLGRKAKGFYVDVGANDPWRFNNTARFYKRGWRGINIEPDPVIFAGLARSRAGDTNLNIGVGCQTGQLQFYRFFPDVFSTFSKEQAEYSRGKGLEIVETIEVPVRTLDELLAENCPDRQVDFMSIDVEGTELDVLLSNDWDRFKPAVVVVESAVESAGAWVPEDECDRVMTAAGYEVAAVNDFNVIYKLVE